MEFKAQRRMAAIILKCGQSRIWMDPARLGDISQALTRRDIEKLINDRVIQKLPKQGVSRGRIRYIQNQKKKGRRKGPGSRKGALGSRYNRKLSWMSRIRAQRALLKELLKSGKIDKKTYKDLYKKAKGGFFRSRAHLLGIIEKEEGKQ